MFVPNLNLSFPFCDVQALDLTIAKDERLAVGFFQRAAVMMQINRLEEVPYSKYWLTVYT